LGQKFNNKYNTDLYSFFPERIAEGGIIWDNYPNKIGYKTMCISFNNYPWVDKIYENHTILVHDQNKHIHRNPSLIGTFLKTFHGVPIWTPEELELFAECFEEIGIQIK
jgi:hypothetical protein